MKKLLLIIICFSGMNLYSQNNIFPQENISVSVQTALKLKLFEENIMILIDTLSNTKHYNTEIVEIELDTLNNYKLDIVFYSFKIGKNKVSSLNKNFDIYFNSSSCNEYVLAFNARKNASYRLKGFNGNDLLFLLRDIRSLSMSKISNKKLLLALNDLNVGLDFISVYKALLNLDFEAECLIICSDGKKAHGKYR